MREFEDRNWNLVWISLLTRSARERWYRVRNYGGTQALGYALGFVEGSNRLGQACDL
ncbi:hypothetical protein Syun_003603 [Stephania yunnanensis]|uniref:Uncharacterized protein n=1 Tax=Stephania yunnanensis TaxID=152371 RepID=A0AAP0Q423_9MAGN